MAINFEEQALKDYNAYKNNKIHTYELYKKMEESPEYKKYFFQIIQLSAPQMVQSGYLFDSSGIPLKQEGDSGYQKYAEQAIENLIRQAKADFNNAPASAKAIMLNSYNEKYPTGFGNSENEMHITAIDDFKKSKENKISEPEIAIKMERNEDYKNAIERLCDNESQVYMAQRNIPLHNKDYYTMTPGGQKFNSIQTSYSDLINNVQNANHKKQFLTNFEKNFGERFPLAVSNRQALKDFKDFNNNKISYIIINDRLEASPEYKESFLKVASEEAKFKIDVPTERTGYIQKIIDFIKNSTQSTPEIVANRARKDYEQTNGPIHKNYLNKGPNLQQRDLLLAKFGLNKKESENKNNKSLKF